MRNAFGSRVGVLISWMLVVPALGCAPEAPPDDEAAASEELASGGAIAPIRTRAEAIRVMNSIERNMHQLDRLETKLVGDFNDLGAAAAQLDAAANALTEAVIAATSTPSPEAAGGIGTNQALLAATQKMQEMNQSFNLQYLALQQKMQDESRRFTLISNIMKTKHDTVKNSISNIR